MIPNSSYHQPAVLQQELDRLFATGWQFVAMAQELADNRDFVCLDLPGVEIVVQNFSGELRGFRNICTHRLNRLQYEDRGSRPLTCRYHGWSFDRDGAPKGLPERYMFVADAEARRRLCLKRYAVEACGDFVFVSLDPDPEPLDIFLGEFADLLRTLSPHIGPQIHYDVVPHRANWKLLVENVLECYHCAAVHPDTFVAGLGVGKKPIADVRFAGRHSSSHFPRVPTRREAVRKKILSHLEGRGFVHDSFFHIYIFPNLFISSTEGASFYVGHALPRSPAETDLRSRFFEAKADLSTAQRARQDAINKQGIGLGLQVIDEDRKILENVQRGLGAADFEGVLGTEEVRIRAFMEAYAASMEARPYHTPDNFNLRPGVAA